jgi:ATP adenylyltransferase
MKRLFAAWRMKFIEKTDKEAGCIFCNALGKEDDDRNLIILRGKRSFVIVNKYPYTSGHLMVAPMDHQPSLEMLDAETRSEMMELVSQCVVTLRKVYNPQAFNVGANIGAAAGAGVPDHVHMHIVPRWVGDTSYMTTIGEVRVLPEAVEETYRRVKEGMG